jgi:Lon protease-like protein
MSNESSSLTNFAGLARLFPLPDLVFFPHVMQALHIFEPRYRQMTADALAGDRLIALVMLQAAREQDDDRQPAIHSVACLGKIVAEQALEDGRYHLLLRGLSRVRILREVANGKLYRSAEVAILKDIEARGPSRKLVRQRLIEAVTAGFPSKGAVFKQLSQILRSRLPLGAVADILTFALPLSPAVRQQQLEEVHVERRVECLLEYLAAQPGSAKVHSAARFPPDFSAN